MIQSSGGCTYADKTRTPSNGGVVVNKCIGTKNGYTARLKHDLKNLMHPNHPNHNDSEERQLFSPPNSKAYSCSKWEGRLENKMKHDRWN
jgi:hypothetical protein